MWGSRSSRVTDMIRYDMIGYHVMRYHMFNVMRYHMVRYHMIICHMIRYQHFYSGEFQWGNSFEAMLWLEHF